MVLADGPKIFDVHCIWRSIILSLEKIFVFKNYISFRFYVKYIWKKCYKNFFGYIFLGAHTVQKVPKYIWMRHCIEFKWERIIWNIKYLPEYRK